MPPSELYPSELYPSEPSPGGGWAPTRPQRWNLYAGFAQAAGTATAKREIRAWSALAVLSLGVAGVFALLVALSRVPGAAEAFPWPVRFFEKGLVIHVVLSFVVWFLSILGALSVPAAYRVSAGRPRWNGLGMAGAVGAGVASVLLFVPALMDRGEPSLNNYVPVIIDPVYYGGLALLGLSIALPVIRLFANLVRREGPLEPVSLSVAAVGLLYMMALASFALAWLKLEYDPGAAVTAAFNEDLFWGGGHGLQFVNTGLMLGAWYILGGIALERPFVHPRLMTAVLLLLVVSALPAPFFYVLFEPFSAAQTEAFTNLQYLLAPPVALAVAAGALGLWQRLERADPVPWRDLSFQCLLLSIFVFAVGGVLGLFVDGGDTRTPAHYHGVIGGINLAFMGLFFALLLPLMGRAVETGKSVFACVWLYAVGQLLHSIGLFWAGGYGAPRKTAGLPSVPLREAGAEGGFDALGANAGLYLMGVGAVIAVIGGVTFIVIVGKALLKKS